MEEEFQIITILVTDPNLIRNVKVVLRDNEIPEDIVDKVAWSGSKDIKEERFILNPQIKYQGGLESEDFLNLVSDLEDIEGVTLWY